MSIAVTKESLVAKRPSNLVAIYYLLIIRIIKVTKILLPIIIKNRILKKKMSVAIKFFFDLKYQFKKKKYLISGGLEGALST